MGRNQKTTTTTNVGTSDVFFEKISKKITLKKLKKDNYHNKINNKNKKNKKRKKRNREKKKFSRTHDMRHRFRRASERACGGPLSVVGALLSFTYLCFFYVSRPQFPPRVILGNLVFFHFSFLWKEKPLVWGRSYRIRDLGTRGRWPCPAPVF